MEAADLIGLLVEATLATSAAVLLALILRRPLRKAFGPTIAYALWLLVPAAIFAVLLPAAEAPAVMAGLQDSAAMGAATPMPVEVGTDYAAWVAATWLLGAVSMAAWFARQQRAFRQRLGQLRRVGNRVSQADGIAGLPAVIGVWRPLIVLPGDFQTRYSPAQRHLMQAHEAMHVHSGDLQINALVATLRCVFWFNPLLHVAARQFRHDQELACDHRVIARHPNARRDYGEAMLKIQLAAQPLPLGCHWAAFEKARSHPLKERIAMLKQPAASSSRWWAGSTVVAIVLASSAVAAWAAQPHRVAADATTAVAPPPPPAPPVPPPAPPAPPAPPSHAAAGLSLPAAAPPAPPLPSIPPPPRPPAVAPPALPDPAEASTPAPKYPPQALANRISGKVVLVIDVDAQGTPLAVEVEQSEPAGVFDQAAVDAAMKWRLEPTMENGRPVPGRMRVPVEFKAPAIAKAPSSPGGSI